MIARAMADRTEICSRSCDLLDRERACEDMESHAFQLCFRDRSERREDQHAFRAGQSAEIVEHPQRIREPLEIYDRKLRNRTRIKVPAHHRPGVSASDLEPFFDQLRANQRARLPVRCQQHDVGRWRARHPSERERWDNDLLPHREAVFIEQLASGTPDFHAPVSMIHSLAAVGAIALRLVGPDTQPSSLAEPVSSIPLMEDDAVTR